MEITHIETNLLCPDCGSDNLDLSTTDLFERPTVDQYPPQAGFRVLSEPGDARFYPHELTDRKALYQRIRCLACHTAIGLELQNRDGRTSIQYGAYDTNTVNDTIRAPKTA